MRSSAKKVAMEAKAKSRAAITLVEGGAERPGRVEQVLLQGFEFICPDDHDTAGIERNGQHVPFRELTVH